MDTCARIITHFTQTIQGGGINFQSKSNESKLGEFMNSFAPHGYFPHLRHREAQLGQLDITHQRDGDAVGQNQVAVDEVLDEAVREAAVRTEGSSD